MSNLASRPSRHAHKLIAKTARDFAADLYDTVMANNEVRKAWKDQNPECTERQLLSRFIERNAGACLPAARATLALMLRSAIPDELKYQILEALTLDATLIRGRGN